MSIRTFALAFFPIICTAGPVAPRQTSAAAAALPSTTSAAQPSAAQPSAYQLVDDYSTASAFFNGFTFFNESDPTNGFVEYVTQDTAFADGLAGMNPKSNSIYLGVDSKSQAPSGRASTRLSSNKIYNHGLFVLDLLHMPGGICGVWPAFWMLGTGTWPANGEIDIMEGVNTQTANQMTLHTGSGCSMASQNTSQVAEVAFTGKLATADCDVNDPNQPKNAGCGVVDGRSNTFGTQFNAQGGGVLAVQWTSSAISIWNFPRSQVPADINAASPNPAGWGTPASMFASQSCDLDTHVKDQQIVFDTTFCGDWAGQTWSSDAQCAAKAATCEQYVANTPGDFVDAYWEIKSLKVYQ